MCSRTTCRKCGKPTWSGCGQHIEIALKGVLKGDRCQGHANDPKEPGFFSRIFGKKQNLLFKVGLEDDESDSDHRIWWARGYEAC